MIKVYIFRQRDVKSNYIKSREPVGDDLRSFSMGSALAQHFPPLVK